MARKRYSYEHCEHCQHDQKVSRFILHMDPCTERGCTQGKKKKEIGA